MRWHFALLAVLATSAGVLCAAGAAGNSAGFDDRLGDVTDSADIARVEASNDDSGNVTFRVLLANRPTGLAANEQIWLFLDTDENPATGGSLLGLAAFGFDYVLSAGPSPNVPGSCGRSVSLGDRTAGFMRVDPGSLACSSGQGDVTLRINRSDLGGSTGFNLLAASYIWDPLVNGFHLHDQAPDCGDTWNYKISTSPTPAAQPCAAPPPPPAPPAPEHTAATLTPTKTSASVSVAVEDPIVVVTAVASRPVAGFNLTSFKNVTGERTSTAIARLKITKRATRLKVTARVTGVEPGDLDFKVKARHVPKKTRVRVTVRQQNA